MNLDFGTEYDSFRDEVREFCDRYKGVQVTGSLFQYLEATNSNNAVSYTHLRAHET